MIQSYITEIQEERNVDWLHEMTSTFLYHILVRRAEDRTFELVERSTTKEHPHRLSLAMHIENESKWPAFCRQYFNAFSCMKVMVRIPNEITSIDI